MEKNIKGVYFVLVVIFIDCLGIGIVMPVMPDLIVEVSGKDIGHAAVYGGWMMMVYATMQFLFAPVLGNLGDRFGRRPILLLSMLGLFLDYVLFTLASTLWLLFLARFIGGLFGASFSTANAYIADVTTAENRAHGFGLVGAAFGLGFVLGPMIGGLLGSYGSRVPFIAAAILAFVNMCYGYFVMPESLPADKRRSFSWARANAFGAFKQILKVPAIHLLLIILFLHQFAFHANPAVWSYFTIEKFDWSQKQIGLSFAVIGASMGFVQAVLVKKFVGKYTEKNVVVIGLIMSIAGFIGYAFAPNSGLLLTAILVWAFAGLTVPAIQSLITQQVAEEEQGEMQGIATAIYSLTAMISPIVMTQVFYIFSADKTSAYFPGAPYLFAAGLASLALILAIIQRKRISS